MPSGRLIARPVRAGAAVVARPPQPQRDVGHERVACVLHLRSGEAGVLAPTDRRRSRCSRRPVRPRAQSVRGPSRAAGCRAASRPRCPSALAEHPACRRPGPRAARRESTRARAARRATPAPRSCSRSRARARRRNSEHASRRPRPRPPAARNPCSRRPARARTAARARLRPACARRARPRLCAQRAPRMTPRSMKSASTVQSPSMNFSSTAIARCAATLCSASATVSVPRRKRCISSYVTAIQRPGARLLVLGPAMHAQIHLAARIAAAGVGRGVHGVAEREPAQRRREHRPRSNANSASPEGVASGQIRNRPQRGFVRAQIGEIRRGAGLAREVRHRALREASRPRRGRNACAAGRRSGTARTRARTHRPPRPAVRLNATFSSPRRRLRIDSR